MARKKTTNEIERQARDDLAIRFTASISMSTVFIQNKEYVIKDHPAAFIEI